MRAFLVVSLGVGLLGCGDDGSPAIDGGADASRADGAASDVGVDPPDTGSEVDSGTVPGDCAGSTLPALRVEAIASTNFEAPVHAIGAPGDAETIYVVEKTGRIIVVRGGERVGVFLDVREGLLTEGEQGLLGLAFHPGYASNGRFFVFFTPGGPRRNVVAEFRRSSEDPFRADPDEVARLVEIEDRESNHNGGHLAFGPDGFLYVGTGDEGGGGDPYLNSLNVDRLLGKMLRLDVDAPEADYAAAGNPFAATGRPQVFHYGLRNPWRWSFDRGTGDLYVADVGQEVWEEITIVPAGAAGLNFGWSAYEGTSVYREDRVSMVPVHTAPQIVYRHNDSSAPVGGVSIVGGVVYRGDAIPGLRGWYLYGDTYNPHIGAVAYCDGEVTQHLRVPGLSGRGGGLVSFGEDGRGEVLLSFIEGQVVRIVPN
ncbi:MAG: PQQ-dependent sugar dehydrogenase [Myxococcota bacterium]|nr:PQQ-dependent sugar dehydrogenase [Myxococcota bacterium]